MSPQSQQVAPSYRCTGMYALSALYDWSILSEISSILNMSTLFAAFTSGLAPSPMQTTPDSEICGWKYPMPLEKYGSIGYAWIPKYPL